MSAIGKLLDAAAGIGRIVGTLIEDQRHRWAEYATEQPGPAALLLERAAFKLEASVEAMRPKRRERWIARRRLARAKARRELADDIRRHARHETCEKNPLRRPL